MINNGREKNGASREESLVILSVVLRFPVLIAAASECALNCSFDFVFSLHSCFSPSLFHSLSVVVVRRHVLQTVPGFCRGLSCLATSFEAPFSRLAYRLFFTFSDGRKSSELPGERWSVSSPPPLPTNPSPSPARPAVIPAQVSVCRHNGAWRIELEIIVLLSHFSCNGISHRRQQEKL